MVCESRIDAFEGLVEWLDIDGDVAWATTDVESADESNTVRLDETASSGHQ